MRQKIEKIIKIIKNCFYSNKLLLINYSLFAFIYEFAKFSDKMDFYNFQLEMARNTEMARGLFMYLQEQIRPDVFTLPATFGERFCFKINFTHGLFQLSISCPPDLSYASFETALFDNENNFMYNDDLGYDDVCRFDTVEEVFAEILRLGESA